MTDLEEKIRQAEERVADRRRAVARQYRTFEVAFAKRADLAKKVFAALGVAWTLSSILRKRRVAAPPTRPLGFFARLSGIVAMLMPLLRYTPFSGVGPVLRLLSGVRR